MSSWSEFIHMGGYAMYVWPSYALGLIVLVANVVIPLLRKKQIIRDISRKMRQEGRR
jgi:heme exporter protein D